MIKNPFKRLGFDSMMGQNVRITGKLEVCGTTVLDCEMYGDEISQISTATLFIGSNVTLTKNVEVDHVTVTGRLICEELIVRGTLAIKKNAEIKAAKIKYEHLVMEPGAIVHAQLVHMNSDTETVPEGAQVLEFVK